MRGRTENQLKTYKKIEEKIVTYPRYVIGWYYYLKANNLSATTCEDYFNKLNNFMKFIDKNNYRNLDISMLNKMQIIEYFAYIQARGEYSDSYRQTIWSCLNNFFEYLYTMDYINENYLLKSNIKRGKNRDLEKINEHRVLLTKDDFRKILNSVKNGVGSSSSQKYQEKFRNRDMSIILLFMTTGIRKTALREINIDDVDLSSKKLLVMDKGGKTHNYVLADDLIIYLKNWIADRYRILDGNDMEALFISKENGRISGTSIAELIDKYAYAALGYHISPHKLRSGLASILYEEKHDLEYVRRVIGHSNISTTQRYVVTDNKEREEAINIMNNILI